MSSPSNHHQTPEYHNNLTIGRSDSKNPLSTCQGITGSGRPCRRALKVIQGGVVSVLNTNPTVGGVEAEFFCWQHKDQVNTSAEIFGVKRSESRLGRRLRGGRSLDSLVEKIGVLSVTEEREDESLRKGRRMERKKFANAEESRQRTASKSDYQPVQGFEGARVRTVRRPPGFWESIFCMSSLVSEEDLHPRVRRSSAVRPTGLRERPTSTTSTPQMSYTGVLGGVDAIRSDLAPLTQTKPITTRERKSSDMNRLTPNSTPKRRPHAPSRDISQSEALLSHIPKSLAPHTTAQLLAELAKPLSTFDEAGYIYMFWLTPESKDAPTPSTTSSLLGSTPSPVLNRNGSKVAKAPLLFKIGRAGNVHKRLNEWQRQCGYNLSLIRYYPHMPTPLPSPSNSPSSARKASLPGYSNRTSPPVYTSKAPSGMSSSTPEQALAIGGHYKVPNVHRVERLIHLELASNQVKQNCKQCGKTHREWFAVDASKEGVRAVDEIVSRWIGWSLGSGPVV
jgi:Meiotically up-regulated gene 113